MSLKISVIIPVYNSEQYLENCLKSIVSQTYKNIEIIIVNDGSTDFSLSICKSFAEKDSRIIVLNQSNLGQGTARNKGLEIATGQYISFVDSDDTISDDLFFENIKILDNDNLIDFIQFPRFINYGTKHGTLIKIDQDLIIPENSLYQSWLEYKIISWIVCDKIYRRELFSSLRFQEGMVYEDNYLVADILQISKKIYISNKGKYYYWSRDNSTTTKKHSLKKDIDTQKVSLHILNKIKSISNIRNGKIIILTRIFYVYRSLLTYSNYEFEIDDLFIKEFKKMSFIAIINSKLHFKQMLKLVLVKIVGVDFYLKK